MEYKISNQGLLNAHNAIGGTKPIPPCKCWKCRESDKVTFQDSPSNTKIIAYCARCDTQFNVDRLKPN